MGGSMATIITVHGTGATGPESGDKWWQRGSEFEKHVRELVESSNGAPLTLQPHIWDGHNSETSRRAAATGLLAKTAALEGNAERYCLIGHSHGGSVIGHALLQATIANTALPNMGRWITIGTPYIITQKLPFLFSRLGLFGKSGYVAVICYILMVLTYIAVALFNDLVFRLRQRLSLVDFFTGIPLYELALFFAPFAALYGLVRYLSSRRLRAHGSRYRSRAKEVFSARGVSFWHFDDEAIGGLRSLPNVRFNIFPRDFAVGPLSFLAVFAVPGLIFFALNTPAVVAWIVQLSPDAGGMDWDKFVQSIAQDPIAHRLILLWAAASQAINAATKSLGLEALSVPIALFGLPLVLFLISLVATFLTTLIARGLSAALSRVLNSAVLHQIRSSAFGSDAVGESATSAALRPVWLETAFAPLPRELAMEISNISNTAAGAALVKYRNLIGTMAFADEKDIRTTLFSEYLTWNELVHTTYFNVPRFRMLVAYAISQAEGFHATAALKNHPDYELVGRWYQQIQQKNIAGAEARERREVASSSPPASAQPASV